MKNGLLNREKKDKQFSFVFLSSRNAVALKIMDFDVSAFLFFLKGAEFSLKSCLTSVYLK